MPMSEPRLRRVDLDAVEALQLNDDVRIPQRGRGIRWWVPPTCVVLSVAQSVVTIAANDIRGTQLSGTLIPVMGFALLLTLVLVVNPLCNLMRRVRIGPRAFNRAELATVFASLLVTAGISTFGLAEQLVPLVAAPYNINWNTPQRGWSTDLLPHLNPHLYLTDTAIIDQFRAGMQMQPAPDATFWDRMALHWHTATLVPWGAWAKPLGWWMIFIVGVYGLFYSLAYFVLPLWADREKLIFPLAKLPESLLPDEGDTTSRVPAMFRSVGFWLAFAIVFGAISWNAMIAQRWFGGANPIRFGMARWTVDELLIQSWVFSPLRGSVSLLIMFTAIGIAFMLPLEMSFSVWFYYLASRLLLLIVCWMGYGASGLDFPSDIWSNASFLATQGAGGMFLFAAISLVRCALEYRSLARGATRARRIQLAIPVVGIAVFLAVLLAWLRWNNVPLWLGGLILLVITLLTVGMMRIVAESGVYWLQAHTGIFHLHKMLGLSSVIHGSIVAPLLPIYSIFFLDLKSFIAPNLVNASKMQQDDAAHSRWRFHLTILASMIASIVASLMFAIYLGYRRGAKSMHEWFYTTYPQLVFENARTLTGRGDKFNWGLTTWFILGACWVGFSVFIRRSVFWFPHPLGYVMLVNPLMSELWLSFFIAWCCKRFVVKYGGKSTYDQVRGIAIGIIVGELVAIALWTCVALYSGIRMPGVSLNRYGA